jgi:hypothetical protein
MSKRALPRKVSRAEPVGAGTLDPASIGRKWREAGQEPTLEQVLADPIVHLLMLRDGIELAALNAVIAQARAVLARNPAEAKPSETVADVNFGD